MDAPLVDPTPFYCEENVWRQGRAFVEGGRDPADFTVWWFTHGGGLVPLFNQTSAEEGQPLGWDYHAVLVEGAGRGGRVWDHSSRLGLPAEETEYLLATVPDPATLPEVLRFSVREIPLADYLARFHSDRSHMRLPGGGWREPPPEGPPPTCGAGDRLSLADLNDLSKGLGLPTHPVTTWPALAAAIQRAVGDEEADGAADGAGAGPGAGDGANGGGGAEG